LGFQPASLFRDEFFGLRCTLPLSTKPEKIRSNCK
jgi:hypothetical protein